MIFQVTRTSNWSEENLLKIAFTAYRSVERREMEHL